MAGVEVEIPLSLEQVQENARKEKLDVSDKEIESSLAEKRSYLQVVKGKDIVNLALTRSGIKLRDQFDGNVYDPSQNALGDNNPDYITAAHIVPEVATKNAAIMFALNSGFANKFDVNDRRNIILIKNKYAAGLNAHKIGITWSKQKGYYIQVHQDDMQEFGDIHDKPVQFFEHCQRIENPQFAPYRRAVVYSYLALTRSVNKIYQEMRKICLDD